MKLKEKKKLSSVAIRIPEDLAIKARILAAKQNKTRSAYIREILIKLLENEPEQN